MSWGAVAKVLHYTVLLRDGSHCVLEIDPQ